MEKQHITINLQSLIGEMHISSTTGEGIKQKDRTEIEKQVTDILIKVLNNTNTLSKPEPSTEDPILQVIRETLDMDIPITEKLFAIDRFILRHKTDKMDATFKILEEMLSSLAASSDGLQP